MKYLPLVAAILFALFCLALAGSILFSGQVYMLARRGSSSVWGPGAYVMAAAWVSLGISAIFAALMPLRPWQYYVFKHYRDVAIFIFAVGFIIATWIYMAQQTGAVTK